jgi:hypothetical protein
MAQHRFDSELNDCIFKHDFESALTIIRKGDPSPTTIYKFNGSSAIHFAAQSGNVDLVVEMVKHNPAVLFSKNSDGHGPLYWAIAGYDTLQKDLYSIFSLHFLLPLLLLLLLLLFTPVSLEGLIIIAKNKNVKVNTVVDRSCLEYSRHRAQAMVVALMKLGAVVDFAPMQRV